MVPLLLCAAFAASSSLEPEPPREPEREPPAEVAGAIELQDAPPGFSVDARSLVSRGYFLRYRPDQKDVKVSDPSQASLKLAIHDDLGTPTEVALEASFVLAGHEYRVRVDEEAAEAAGVGGSGEARTGMESEVDTGGVAFADESLPSGALPDAPLLAKAKGRALVVRDGAPLAANAEVEVFVLEQGILLPGRERPVGPPGEDAGPEVHLVVHGLPTGDVREGRAHLAFGSVQVKYERRVEAEEEE